MVASLHKRVDLSTARAIARLCYPERPVQGQAARAANNVAVARTEADAESGDLASAHLIDACIRNKVPLLSLPRTPLVASAHHRQAIEEEHIDWANTRREYLVVQDAFEGQSIRAVLIKSAGISPSLPYRSDNLDVLIDPRHDRQARRILLDLGYVEVTNVEEPLKFLFRKFHLGASVSAIHLHESVGWGTGFMDDTAVLVHARLAPDDPAIWIPSTEDALLINMAHAFYEDKEIKLGDLWKIMHLLRTERLDWDRVERQATGRGWADGLYTCILLWSSLEQHLYDEHSFPVQVVELARQRVPAASASYLQKRVASEPSFPFAISFRFSKRLYYGKVLRDPALPARQKAIDITRHTLAGFKRRLPFATQPAMLITLSGIDGSGKTVQAQVLCKAFQQCEVDARVVWMRGGSSPFADRVIGLVKPWLVRERSRGETRTRPAGTAALPALAEIPAPADPDGPDVLGDTRQAKVARKSAWLRRPLLRVGWTSLVSADLLLTCLRRVWWPIARGRVVICDRYFYDALVEMAALADSEHMLTGWAARLLRALCPRPRQAYLLHICPQNAMKRKPDELLPFLEQQAQFYQSAANLWRLHMLDTNNNQGANSDYLVHRVLREYYRDWHTCIAALFRANPLKHDVDG
jgi:thymidylate kinase